MYVQKDLKRMSRKDLLQILSLQSRKIDTLQEKLDELNELLETKQIMLSEAGTIAEASLKINKVFESAQEAANQYLENIKRLSLEKERLKKKVTSKKKQTNTKKKVNEIYEKKAKS